MRCLRRILLALIAILMVATLSSPWWIPIPLRWILAHNDITVATVETNGCTRIVLTGLHVDTPQASITIARAELDTPALLLLRRLIGSPSPAIIERWFVAIKPSQTLPPGRQAQRPQNFPKPSSTGTLETRDAINQIRAQLTPWLPAFRAINGTIQFTPDAAPLYIATADWLAESARSQAILKITNLTYRQFTADATLAWDDTTHAATLTSAIRNPHFAFPLDITATLAADTLTGTLNLDEQSAALTARFAPDHWLPDEATLDTPTLALNATQIARLKIPAPYNNVIGNAHIAFQKNNYKIQIAARASATPPDSLPSSPSTLSSAPPIDIVIAAQGTPERLALDTLDITLPGITAHLDAPVEITRDLCFAGQSRFTLDADLTRQPWYPATGRLTGEITLDTTDTDLLTTSTTPKITARLNYIMPDGTEVRAVGHYDDTTRAIHDATLHAKIPPAALAPWFPENITFDTATLDITLDGPLAAPTHTGALTAENLNLAISSQDAELRLSATDVTQDHAIITALTLRSSGTERLSLTAPATLTRSPSGTLALTTLNLSGNAASSNPSNTASQLALQFTLAPRGPANLEIHATDIDSTWLSPLINIGPLAWHINAATLAGAQTAPGTPLSATLTTSVRVNFTDENSALLNANISLSESTLAITNFTITDGSAPIAEITGHLPVSIFPRATAPHPLTQIERDAPIALEAHTDPASPFWQNLAQATGITLENPRIDAHLRGTLQKPDASADIAITRLNIDRVRWSKKLAPLSNSFTIPPLSDFAARFSTDGTTLAIDNLTLRIAGQLVQASAKIPTTSLVSLFEKTNKNALSELLRNATINIELPGIEISAFSSYANALVAPRGRISAKLHLSPGQPVTGNLNLNEAALRPIAPIGVLSDIKAEARLDGSRITIIQSSARLGSEAATLTGTIDLPALAPILIPSQPHSAPRTPHATFPIIPDIALKATNIPFVRQPGFILRGDLDLRLTTTEADASGETDLTAETTVHNPPAARIQGTITLHDSLYLANLSSLWTARPGSGPASRPPFFAIETPPFNTWPIDVTLRGEHFLRIQTPIFKGTASANFKLQGTLGEPRAIGEATIDSGNILFPFATFAMQAGRIRLAEADPFTPVLDLTATATALGYDLTMQIAGSAATPQITFTSSPALTSEQIILFVMAGESPVTDYDYSTQQRALSLGAYIGQNFINELFGLASDKNRLSLLSGEKLTRQGRETYNIEYKLSNRWSAVGEYDEFDAYNIGLKWRIYTSPQPKPSSEIKIVSPDPAAPPVK